MIKQYKLYYALLSLIVIDILLTFYSVNFMGAIEKYPLLPFTISFNNFLIIKCFISCIGLIGLFYFRKEKYLKFFITILIFLYAGTLFWNLWQTANYLYY
jgi:hypothetical protein